jgi:hypothetical protein
MMTGGVSSEQQPAAAAGRAAGAGASEVQQLERLKPAEVEPHVLPVQETGIWGREDGGLRGETAGRYGSLCTF